MFQDQDYKCGICETDVHDTVGENDPKRGVVDHDHETNLIRGILCHDCNRALGLVKDNKETLKRMLEYLT